LSKDTEIAKKELEKRKDKELVDKLQICLKENVVLAGGFAAGFLLGMASA
jgi:hypothetical protein